MIPKLDQAHLEHIMAVDIPAWQDGTGDWFTIRLLNLITTADGGNKERIRQGFPEVMGAYERWYHGES